MSGCAHFGHDHGRMPGLRDDPIDHHADQRADEGREDVHAPTAGSDIDVPNIQGVSAWAANMPRNG